MSDITASELIAVNALLELQAEVRVKDTGDDADVKRKKKVDPAPLVPSTSGVSNNVQPSDELVAEPSNAGPGLPASDDALSEPSTSKQAPQKISSTSNRPALCPKRLKLYNDRRQRRTKRITKRSVGSQSDVSLHVATLDTVQCLLMGLYSRVKSWLVESDQDSSEEDDDEIQN